MESKFMFTLLFLVVIGYSKGFPTELERLEGGAPEEAVKPGNKPELITQVGVGAVGPEAGKDEDVIVPVNVNKPLPLPIPIPAPTPSLTDINQPGSPPQGAEMPAKFIFVPVPIAMQPILPGGGGSSNSSAPVIVIG